MSKITILPGIVQEFDVLTPDEIATVDKVNELEIKLETALVEISKRNAEVEAIKSSLVSVIKKEDPSIGSTKYELSIPTETKELSLYYLFQDHTTFQVIYDVPSDFPTYLDDNVKTVQIGIKLSIGQDDYYTTEYNV